MEILGMLGLCILLALLLPRMPFIGLCNRRRSRYGAKADPSENS